MNSHDLASDDLPPKCAATNAAGEPCRMKPLKGSAFCWNHDPTNLAQRKLASRRGGKARSYPVLHDGSPIPFDAIADVQRELAKLYGQTAAAQVPPERARVLNSLLGRAIECLNVGLFEERIAALEAALGPRRVA